MAFGNKTIVKKDQYMTTIKRCIVPTEEVKEFIKLNSNYRRYVWNSFVAEYRRCVESGEKFKSSVFKKKFFNEFEVPNKIYETHCVGISEGVMKDIDHALEICKIQHGTLNMKRYDPFKYSFKVHTKANGDYLGKYFNSRVNLRGNMLIFRTRGKERMEFELKELFYGEILEKYDNGMKLYRDTRGYYSFTDVDIKSISFLYEDGKHYILLQVKVLNLYKKKVFESYKRFESAGIDLGIRHPITLVSDYEKSVFDMTPSEKEKMVYLEGRARKLQRIMDRKMKYNKDHGLNPYSKNYRKVQRKFRITWQKIVNIRINWRRKLSKFVACRYNRICVDSYTIPLNSQHETSIKKLIHKYNFGNRWVGMYLLDRALIHACAKYKTEYIESPKHSTRICSKCGELNDQIPLSETIFVCKFCGFIEDRDVNAAQNCFIRSLQ